MVNLVRNKTVSKPPIQNKDLSQIKNKIIKNKEGLNENNEYRNNAKYDQTTSLKDNKRVSRSSILDK